MVDVGFLGGAQIDHYGNINSTVIGDYQRPKVRFPGSGGANDIASLAKRILVIAPHEKRRFPERCAYVTSPGYLDGPEARKKAGLKSLYPDLSVVTDLAVMSVDKTDGRLKVSKLMPGVSFKKVQESTEFKVEAASSMAQVSVPAPDELRILRDEVDPGREYLGKGD
jgi:glutaconate CoA-transferase subunit B